MEKGALGCRAWTREDRVASTLTWAVLVAIVAAILPGADAEAQSLRGSPASLDRQNQQARAHNFTYLETAADVHQFVAAGYLVPVEPNENLRVLSSVSFPYARPASRLFLERLSQQYRAACGERLVVTSLTRPHSHQPPNASSRSVHPTGMAIDLRVSQNAQCRSWLESTLLSLEAQGVLEAIREYHPPHYHLTVFPDPYRDHVARVAGEEEASRAEMVASGSVDVLEHPVRPGETLTAIARQHDVSVSQLRSANGLQGDRIVAGQTLEIPVQTAASPAQNAAEVAEHQVQNGDTLIGIARRYGVSVDRIRTKNDLSGDRIRAGEVIHVPQGGSGS